MDSFTVSSNGFGLYLFVLGFLLYTLFFKKNEIKQIHLYKKAWLFIGIGIGFTIIFYVYMYVSAFSGLNKIIDFITSIIFVSYIVYITTSVLSLLFLYKSLQEISFPEEK